METGKKVSKKVILDYLSFTIDYSIQALEHMIDYFDYLDPIVMGYGGIGYQNSLRLNGGGRIYWHSERPEMGIHIRLGSKTLALFEGTALGLINLARDWGGRFTRIDIAFDDFDGVLDMRQMYECLLAGEYTGRFRTLTRYESYDQASRLPTGETLNLGSRQSTSFIRIYDKLLEMRSRGKELKEIEHWVRVELELKGDRASVLADMLGDLAISGDGGEAGRVCAELLYGLLDFKVPNPKDINKARWDTCDWWLDFVAVHSKSVMAIPKHNRTMGQVLDWFRGQIATSLALILLKNPDDGYGNGYDFIMDAAKEGEEKLRERHIKILNDNWSEGEGERLEPD